MYIVTGATGKTGQLIAEILLSKGKKVRAIGRSGARLGSIVDRGAEPFIGSVADSFSMERAFQDTQAAYLIVPPEFAAENPRQFQNDVGRAYAWAIRSSGITHAVSLSSIGADLSEGAGVVSGLYDVEQRLNQIENLNVIHLRAGFFMENFFSMLDLIRTRNLIASSLKRDVPIPMIATKDIADAAARLLLHMDFSGHSVRELLGQRDISMEEATEIIGKAIGKKDLAYVQLTYEQAEDGMAAMGMGRATARSLNELYRGINEGRVHSVEGRTAENSTPTPFEHFVSRFAIIYQARERKHPAA